MRTRNFRARNEVIDRGAVTTSRKGTKANVEEKVGDCGQWTATGQCSKGDSCSFSHGQADDRPLPHQIRRQTQTEMENHPNHLTKRMKDLLIEGSKNSMSMEKIVPIRRVVTGILPCVRTIFQRQHANMTKNAISDTLSLKRSPTRSRIKVVQKDQLLC